MSINTAVFEAIRQVLEPGDLFYLGLYGGNDFEGVWADDWHEPERFFSFHTDEGIQQAARRHFTLLPFERVEYDPAAALHFQSLLLRR